ncbi:HigA family addiction module antitoxin [Luteococcus japonicus]|nr:HigA family addiction module antitoxin [Luteococcus japonicus]
MMKVAEAFAPGEYLADELEARDWSQADFAGIIGRPVQFVSEIINGKKELTAESAQQIGAALETSPEFWLNLQNRYNLWLLEQDSAAVAKVDRGAARAEIAKIIPLVALEKRGVIDRDADVHELKRQVLRDFNMASTDDTPQFALAAKRSNSQDEVSLLQRGWLWAAAQKARGAVPPDRYSPEKLQSLAEELPHALREPSDFDDLPTRYRQCGVILVFVEQLPGGKIDGAAFLMGDTPVIAISGRGKRLDKVVFALMHETAHVVAGHLTEGITIDGADAEGRPQLEDEANTLAERWALGGSVEISGAITLATVTELAERLEVAPALVIGNLQHNGKLEWRTTLAKGIPNVDDHLQSWA